MTNHQFMPDPSPESTDDEKIEERNFQPNDEAEGLNIAMLRQVWNKRRLRSEVKGE